MDVQVTISRGVDHIRTILTLSDDKAFLTAWTPFPGEDMHITLGLQERVDNG